MSNKKTKSEKTVEGKPEAAVDNTLSMHEKFANLFLISMFTVFPIYLTDKLFNVRVDRLHYFIATNLILLFFIFATYICGIDKPKWPKKLFKLSVTDWAMFGFLVVNAVSTLLSDYGKDALTGAQGRDSGLILISVYVLCYFMLSRYLKCKEFVYDIFAIASCIVCLIAVLHEFYIDPLDLINSIKEEQRETFITTIGNINLFSAFVCVALPVVVAMLVMSKEIFITIFYGIVTSICFMGLIVANSDSGYFGLVAFMAVLFVFACKNAEKMFKYFLSIFIMLLSCKIINLMSIIFNGEMRELDTLPNTLVFDKRTYMFMSAAGFFAIIFYIVKLKFGGKSFPKAVQIAAGILVGLCAFSIAFVFFYFSFINTAADLGSLTKYLRLNDQWGTHRGYAWIRSIFLFKNGGIKNMLVGTGPDTFGPVIKAIYREDMLKRHGSVFDNAHNEYLNYLVTIGILGAMAYITALVSYSIRCVKRCKDNVGFLIVILVVTSYCSQALFNLATPIVTPYLFVFLGIGEAYIRRNDMSISEKND